MTLVGRNGRPPGTEIAAEILPVDLPDRAQSVRGPLHTDPMSATTDAEGLMARLRASVEKLRAAEFEVACAAAAVDGSDLPAASNYRTGTRLVEDAVRVDPATAKRWIAQGRSLSPSRSFTGEPMPPALPMTAKAAESGSVGADHVRVVARTMNTIGRLPALDPEAARDAEARLADAATRLAPYALDKVAGRVLAHLDPDGVAPLDPPAEHDELHLSTSRRDGSLCFSGRIHGAGDAEMLRETFDALSARAGADDTRPISERRAEALLELAEQARRAGGIAGDGPDGDDLEAESPGDGTLGDGTQGGETSSRRPGAGPARGRPLLMITIDHRDLLRGIGHGLLDSDRTISASEARRLGCDAGIVPMVLGSTSQPLDVGRLSYTVPDGMRRALYQRDRGCAFPGCDRRPRRCHAHHLRHWTDLGETEIDNLALLCRFHHVLIHQGDWEIHMREGRPWFTPPGWIDPLRTPRPGGAHPPWTFGDDAAA